MGANGGQNGGSSRNPSEYRFTIPVLPPSVNALHQIIWSQRKVELKPEIRKWKNDAAVFIPRIVIESDCSLLRVDAKFYYRFHYGNGKLRVFDTHNVLKPLLDLIAQKAGVNDLRMKSGSWDSEDSESERVEVILREVTVRAQ